MNLYQNHIHLSLPVDHNLSQHTTQTGQLYCNLTITITTTIVENLCVAMSAYVSSYCSMYRYFYISLSIQRHSLFFYSKEFTTNTKQTFNYVKLTGCRLHWIQWYLFPIAWVQFVKYNEALIRTFLQIKMHSFKCITM